MAQQLIANGLESYFCKKKNLGELDVLVEIGGKVVPIYHNEKAYVLSVSNVERINQA